MSVGLTRHPPDPLRPYGSRLPSSQKKATPFGLTMAVTPLVQACFAVALWFCMLATGEYVWLTFWVGLVGFGAVSGALLTLFHCYGREIVPRRAIAAVVAGTAFWGFPPLVASLIYWWALYGLIVILPVGIGAAVGSFPVERWILRSRKNVAG